ncbi:MAG: SUMF1/EgtB/PvdO family nonheme iron enzyme [Planctomycetota bacterium]|nr:SUMF1/EgtB/PvdO family nonheme iron enzyme [Planctomycetota bacterium]
MPSANQPPRAFVSSTFADLREHRRFVIDQLRGSGLHVDPMEDWTADNSEPQQVSVQRIDDCDLCVLLVAFRRGCVPTGQTESITQLEYLRACELDIDVLVFLLDDEALWRAKYDERQADPLVESWRRELKAKHVVGFFDHKPESVLIHKALGRWLQQRRNAGQLPPVDELTYLRQLHAQTRWIDIRGLQVGSGRAHRFPIQQLFIPLASVGPAADAEQPDDKTHLALAERRVDLHRSLRVPRLVISGDPGSGKTTFLRRIACELCEQRSGVDIDASLRDAPHVAASLRDAESGLGETGPREGPWWDSAEPPFPLFLRLSDLNEHIRAAHERGDGPTIKHLADWLPHFLASAWRAGCPGADESWFQDLLSSGRAIVLLDGLDEAPSEADRRRLVALIENAATAYERCRFVVTSRPSAVQGQTTLPGFAPVLIAPLESEAIEVFLDRWCRALYVDDPQQATLHVTELLTALRARDDIRRLASNPVMLTAMAVVHWNEKRLPEQRADLYESIITWLARARDLRPGRPKPERCIGLLQNLALAMQGHPDGRQVQVRRRWAAEQIADGFRDQDDPQQRIEAAERFLVEEELDSGIVVARGDDLRYWHLTFQEHLAARALAACTDQERRDRLLATERLYQPEWREVFLLLAGVLHHHGMERVDQMIRVVIDQLPENARLAAHARCAGLLGSVVRDLTPVNYRPKEPRYQQILDDVLGIFDPIRSRQVPIADAIDAADALGQAGDPRFPHGPTPDLWVKIPAGEFRMGSQKKKKKAANFDAEADDDESPVRTVYLDAYKLGRYPVTVAQYRLFVDNDGYADKRHWAAGGWQQFTEPDGWAEQKQHPNWPVTGVSWFEAQAYCRWAGEDYRLPTEAEWERAARGTDGRRFPWGNDEPTAELLNYASNVTHATPVGIYPRGVSPEGLADLAGNVWEWCEDWFGPYEPRSIRNPTGSDKGERRVVRGGAWSNPSWGCRCSCRLHLDPELRSDDIGFRVAWRGQDS